MKGHILFQHGINMTIEIEYGMDGVYKGKITIPCKENMKQSETNKIQIISPTNLRKIYCNVLL